MPPLAKLATVRDKKSCKENSNLCTKIVHAHRIALHAVNIRLTEFKHNHLNLHKLLAEFDGRDYEKNGTVINFFITKERKQNLCCST